MKPKAPYRGSDPGEMPEFRPKLINAIKKCYKLQEGDTGDTADTFAHAVLAEARWAVSELRYSRLLTSQ